VRKRLRPFQKETIRLIEKHGHVLCIAPTGSGKSRIFEEYLRITPSRAILITPLVALARQQAKNLEEYGIRTRMGCGPDSQPIPHFSRPNESEVWIVSPERVLQRPRSVFPQIRSWKPTLLIVDECHCFWDWGDRFRPVFRKIPDLINELKIPSSLWLTATLPTKARSLLKRALEVKIFTYGGFSLAPNLKILTLPVRPIDRPAFLRNFLLKQTSPGIIFMQTRAGAERVSSFLHHHFEEVMLYHAGMSAEERQTIENLIAGNRVRILVCTSAFGMGMDFRQFEWIVFLGPPYSLLTLTQAMGRVGRSGEPCIALVVWDATDFQFLPPGTSRTRDETLALLQFLQTENGQKEFLQSYFDGDSLD